jgi:hypothetical protein
LQERAVRASRIFVEQCGCDVLYGVGENEAGDGEAKDAAGRTDEWLPIESRHWQGGERLRQGVAGTL